jgi:hypothetical protein
MNSAFNALKTAVIETAKADPAVAAICNGRVYEEVPRDDRGDASDARAPFVYLAGFNWRDVEAGCGPLYSVTIRLNSVSTKFGREQSRELAQALKAVFDRKTLALSGGHQMTLFRAIAGGDVQSDHDPKETYLELRTELSDANGYLTP